MIGNPPVNMQYIQLDLCKAFLFSKIYEAFPAALLGFSVVQNQLFGCRIGTVHSDT
jgi:hypothetical protein